MMRRRFLILAVAVLSAAVTLGGPSHADVAAKPNVVVIMTDDQTLEMMRVMTHTRALIGSAGATFENFYVSFPLCCPSRATFLTGQYAHNHLVLENDAPTGGYYRLDSENTLPVWLQRSGYHTMHVGKYLNSYGTQDETEIPPGYDEWYGLVDPTTYHMWGYRLNENGTATTYGTDAEEEDLYQTDLLARRAKDAIERAAGEDEPFYLNFWTLAPHREVDALSAQYPPRPAPRHKGAFANEPMPRTPSFNEADMSDKPAYMQVKPLLTAEEIIGIETRYRAELESLLAVDEAVKTIVDTLAAEGVLDNTYIIYTSDNGFFHGEHRTPVEKLLPYQPSVKVPLLVRGPGIAAGTVVDELTANVDFAPTIAGWTGACPTVKVDGRSFMPSITDGARSSRPVLLELFWPVGSSLGFFTEQIPQPPIPAAGPQIPLAQTIFPYQAIHTGRFVYIEYPSGEHELYDLAVDADQETSFHLDPRYAETMASLAVDLQLLRACSGAWCRRETGPTPEPA